MNPATLTRLYHKFQTVWRWPLAERLQIPLVWVMLGMARAAILTLPFRWYSSLLGQSVELAVFTPVLTPAQTARSRSIRRLVESTAKYTSWESKCLVQALVAAVLLRHTKVPYILHFGLAKNRTSDTKDPMNAHTWITAGAVPVTGGRSLLQFTVVGSYVSSQE